MTDPRPPARHASTGGARPGDGMVRAGAGVFLVGVVAVVIGVVPSTLAGRPGPVTFVVLAAALLPIGLGLALVGLLRAARTGRREARRSAGG